MPTETGIFTQEDTDSQFSFSYRLAQFIGQYFDKKIPVIDLGCGRATYLRYLHDIGFESLHGVEGVELKNSEFGNVKVQDISEDFQLGGEQGEKLKGNVMCLEVGEHIPNERSLVLFENINRHTQKKQFVILSWGIPGQDGLGHINCQHNIWVIDKMEEMDFKLLAKDTLRARSVIENSQCEWFRNTIMIFQKQK